MEKKVFLSVIFHLLFKCGCATANNRFHIIYDIRFSTDINLLESARSNCTTKSNITFLKVANLYDLPREYTLDENAVIFSFTKRDLTEILGVLFTNRAHYSFGMSLFELEDTNKSQDNICLGDTLGFKQTIYSLLISLSVRGVAIIADDGVCSKTFLSSLINLLQETESTSHINLNIKPLMLNFEWDLAEQLAKIFYFLKTIDIPVIILLLPTEYLAAVFNAGDRFGLTSPQNLWLVPSYNREVALTVTPNHLLTFTGIQLSYEKHTYSSIRSSIRRLCLEYPLVLKKCSAEYPHALKKCNVEYSRALKKCTGNDIHSCVRLHLKDALRENEKGMTRNEFGVNIRYKMPDHKWINLHARIDEDKFEILDKDVQVLRSFISSTKKRSLRAVTIIDEPYVTEHTTLFNNESGKCLKGIKCRKYTSANLPQETCCIGYLIDILNIIVEDLNFNVEMYVVKDGKYGAFKRGQWNGLVRDLMDDRADIAIAPLTITEKRSTVIDFTAPYYQGNIGILVQPKIIEPGFLNAEFLPMTLEFQIWLWVVFLGAVLLNYLFENSIYFTSLLLSRGATKISYYQFYESLSNIGGVFLQKGIGGATSAQLGARCSVIILSFGTMIILTTYTAALAANSVRKQEKQPFKGSKDERLRNPKESFKFATLKDSSFETFFRNGKSDILKRMGAFMEKYNYDSSQDEFELIANGRLDAIITDYQAAYYYLSKEKTCNLRLVEDALLQTGIAFGLIKRMQLKPLLDQVILRYIEQEKLSQIEKKWFTRICQPSAFAATKTQLSVNWVGGIVMVLIGVGVVAFPLLLPEHYWYKRMREVVITKLTTFFNQRNTNR